MLKKFFLNGREFIKTKNNKKGFIKTVIIVIMALVLLKYFLHIDIIGILTSGKPKEWYDKVYKLLLNTWNGHDQTIIQIWDKGANIVKNLINKINK